jgi:hypothetical protein
MKLYSSIILTLVVGVAQAGECPRGQYRYTEPDGTRVIVRETGIVTTLSPDNRVDHFFAPVSEEQRINTLTSCNLGSVPVRRSVRLAIVSPTGQVTGYITTK